MLKIIRPKAICIQALTVMMLCFASPTFATEKEAKDDVSVNRTELAEAQQQVKHYKKVIINLQAALIILTLLYIFIYIMGRRRLMLKIWARNKELIRARDKAEESDRMKSAFIRNMSHEIRTPLNAINGFSHLLCSTDYELSNEEREDMKQRISESVNAITTIVNELLDMSLGESRSERKPVSCNEVASKVLEESRIKNKNNVKLEFTSELPDDFTIVSNADNIARILSLLIDNALKFTTEGYVWLQCSKTDEGATFCVEDTGIGIPAEEREHIFEKFVKLDDYAGGVGLGLPVSRRLAELLGGHLKLDSHYDKGCRFVLTLPA